MRPLGRAVGPRRGVRGARPSPANTVRSPDVRRSSPGPRRLLAPPRPARGASWVRGGAGAAPLSGARGRRDRVAAEGWRFPPRRSAPAASRARRHGRPAATRPTTRRTRLHPGLRGGAGEVQRYGVAGPGRSSSLTAWPLTPCPRWLSPLRPRQSPVPHPPRSTPRPRRPGKKPGLSAQPPPSCP